MEQRQAQVNQGNNPQRVSNRRNQKVRIVRGVNRQLINQDWDYLKKDPLPNNASSDQVFNDSYQNNGLQPQNLNKHTSLKPGEEKLGSGEIKKSSRYSRIKSNTPQLGNQSRNRGRWRQTTKNRKSIKKTLTPAASILAKKGLAKGRVTMANSGIFLVGGKLWLFVQLPLALVCFIAACLYIAVSNEYSQLIADVLQTFSGPVINGVAWLFGVNTNLSEVLSQFFLLLLAVTSLLLFILGLFTLLMIYITYRALLLKPLSGSAQILKQGVFTIAALGYSLPLFNLFPWGLLVMWVVWLYPE